MIHYKKYLNMKRNFILLAFIPFLFGCSELFEPAIENHRDEGSLVRESVLAQRTLGHAYLGNPLRSWSFNDVATDDAVSNDPVNGYMRIATGQWSSSNSPMNGNWQNRRGSIQYINFFLSFHEEVEWSKDVRINNMFIDRMKGDAHGMRALFMYHLLLEHAGWTADGQLLGIPILTEPETINSDFNLPRNTFEGCIDQISEDVRVATENLPLFYVPANFKDEDVPEKYKEDGVSAIQYIRVFGNTNVGGRMSGAIAEAILAQAYLLAASSAYNPENDRNKWEKAALQMATVLNHIQNAGSNPIAQIDPTGSTWFLSANVSKEMLWRGDKDSVTTLERDHYPPTHFGRGRLNPTQNLVDAFPMANGYPIGHASSGYNPNDPYAGRDPRLEKYVIYNGSTFKSTVINTAVDGPNNDALGRIETSTRTGYYMKKLLNPVTHFDPAQEPNRPQRYKAYIRYTEMFLGYAEAANEAWGPTDARMGYSAYDVIKAIRARAKVGTTNGDAYLESIKGDKAKMRELIRNERRLELCFEGHRFWDLRRWQAPIKEQANGVNISTNKDSGVLQFAPFKVEDRKFEDYMYHAPIPYSEILKFNNLVQNKGW